MIVKEYGDLSPSGRSNAEKASKHNFMALVSAIIGQRSYCSMMQYPVAVA
jgi:hypothetical protein